MKKLKEKLQHIYAADRAISMAHSSSHLRTQFSISLIVASAFLLLMVFNIFTPSSRGMLTLTAIAASLLYVTSFLGYFLKRPIIIQYSEIFVCAAFFTIFTIIEGNNGFAVLWVILGPLVAMTIVDYKAGFLVGLYFFLMLVSLFWTPLRNLAGFQVYSDVFLIRFPLLYLVGFIFSIYISTRIRESQYNQLQQQEQLKKYQSDLESALAKLSFECESAEYRASHDKLTGLFNREHLQQLRTNGDYDDVSECSLLFFDINGLKLTNDTNGHRSGDNLIMTAAESLRNSLEEHGRIFRIGGDEFLLIIPNCTRQKTEELLSDWRNELERLNKARNTDCVLAVGCAFGDGDPSRDLDDLIREADANMYNDKRRLKGIA